jgi:nucleolar MIF4G domain-containing protein 1
MRHSAASDASEEESDLHSDITDDDIEMPAFTTAETLDQDDAEIEYFAKKLGIADSAEWDEDSHALGFSRLLDGITSAQRMQSESKPIPMIKAVRTEEEESARRDFTGLLNRIAPSNFGVIASRIREAFASHPPEVSIAMFTRCITQRICADAPLPALFLDCYARVVKEVPDAIEPIVSFLGQPEKKELLNVKPFLDALGPDIMAFYGSAKGAVADEEVVKLAQVARQMHMTTDVRHHVFYAITMAVDVIDAFTRITKLKLSKTQRKDVPLVMIECCRKESAYNPFYAALGVHFTEFEKGFDKNLRAALKSTIKLMPGLSVPQIRNVAMFTDDLVEKGALNLGFLKNVKLMRLAGHQVLFVNILLRELFQKWEREEVLREIARIKSMPNFSLDLREFLESRFRPFIAARPGIPPERRNLISKAIDALRRIG